jgi:hypothetical protein
MVNLLFVIYALTGIVIEVVIYLKTRGSFGCKPFSLLRSITRVILWPLVILLSFGSPIL